MPAHQEGKQQQGEELRTVRAGLVWGQDLDPFTAAARAVRATTEAADIVVDRRVLTATDREGGDGSSAYVPASSNPSSSAKSNGRFFFRVILSMPPTSV